MQTLQSKTGFIVYWSHACFSIYLFILMFIIIKHCFIETAALE